MTIYIGSRYEADRQVQVLVPSGGRQVAVFHPVPPDRDFTYTEHIVVDGDRLDLIAYRAYADSSLWWYIADANPDLGVPDPLVPGTRLRVPRAG